MGTGVLLKKGSELGNTFRGWADFQLTDNIIAKTHIGHFTFWHASIVTNPKCLFLAEDIFCTNYVSGEGRRCSRGATSTSSTRTHWALWPSTTPRSSHSPCQLEP